MVAAWLLPVVLDVKKIPITRLADEASERVRAEHHRAISEVQSAPLVGARIVANVLLSDGGTTLVPHGLGKVPQFVWPSAPRDALSSGSIIEVRDTAVDRKRFVALRAMGWGAAITIDLAVL